MQIVIDIPEEAYQKLLEEQHLPNRINLEYFIVHGIPLPKGHGRLIDADALAEKLKQVSKRNKYNELYLDSLLSVADVIDALICDLDGTASYGYEDAPTIILADKEE